MSCRGSIFVKNECYEYSLCMSGVSVSTVGEIILMHPKEEIIIGTLKIFFNRSSRKAWFKITIFEKNNQSHDFTSCLTARSF